MKYDAEVLADSVAPSDVRVTTIKGVYPRFIHAEVLRHRVQSHAVMSSRAVPTEKLIELVRNDMFVPETFHARVKGMGYGDELDASLQDAARQIWMQAGMTMAHAAEDLMEVGIDKSRANRLIEPFLPVVDIITATEWSNFLALRQPDGSDPVPQKEFPAQPEFQIFARMVREAMEESEPKELKYGEWHLPLTPDFTLDGDEAWWNEWARISAGRIAKVSFMKLDFEAPEIGLERQGRLVDDAHWSPSEHPCRPLTRQDVFDDALASKIMLPASFARDLVVSAQADPAAFDATKIGVREDELWCGNLRGFVQLRKLYDLEHDRGQWLQQKTQI